MSPGKERKRSSRVVVMAVILVAVLILSAVTGLLAQVVNNREPRPSGTPVRTYAGTLYNTHSPITIYGNGGFTNASGVVWGSGTASDPYIIANWDINASTALSSSAAGILISGTDAHFIVRNCYVHDGRSSLPSRADYDGIHLAYCVNGTVEGNTCVRDAEGVDLTFSSNNNSLSNNNCFSNTGDGIYIWSSGYETLSNNTCSSNTISGIRLSYTDYLSHTNNNTLSNNTCSNESYGIYLGASNYNMLSNNNCSHNNIGYGLGIYLDESNNNTLINNTCSNDTYGIRLEESSSNNEISRNLICNNTGYGVDIFVFDIYASRDNRIWNNTFIGNNGATDTYDKSHVQARDDGMHNWWNSTDGYGNWWNDWSSSDKPYGISGSAGAKDYYPLVTTQTPTQKPGITPFVEMVLIAVSIGAILIVIELARETRRKKKSGP